ncbi:MAG: hypothetical protein RL670_818 [Actinomycetota bacterium]|jgi:hypothetical protein
MTASQQKPKYTKPVKQFLLAWSISVLTAQPLVALFFANTPIASYSRWWVQLGSIANGISLVSIIAAVVILCLAWPLERLFTRRASSALAAAFSYLGILASFAIFVMAAMTPLIVNLKLQGAAIYLPATVGFASLVSAPVAFVARLLFPQVARRPKLSRVLIWLGVGLAASSLVCSILFQIATRLAV